MMIDTSMIVEVRRILRHMKLNGRDLRTWLALLLTRRMIVDAGILRGRRLSDGDGRMWLLLRIGLI